MLSCSVQTKLFSIAVCFFPTRVKCQFARADQDLKAETARVAILKRARSTDVGQRDNKKGAKSNGTRVYARGSKCYVGNRLLMGMTG